MASKLNLTDAQIDEAVRRGLLSPEQITALRTVASQKPAPQQKPIANVAGQDGDEAFRLVGGGNDVFVAIGIVLLIAGARSALLSWSPDIPTASAAEALLLWLLAEFITRRQRMKFSSLIISAAFIGTIITGLGFWIYQNVDFSTPGNLGQGLALRETIRNVALMATLLVGTAALVWFVRFRVPFMTAVMAVASVVLAGIFVINQVFNRILTGKTALVRLEDTLNLSKSLLWVLLFMGLVVFAIGVVLDLKDRHRDTLLSDCAFWMHVISAPMIVHPLFVLATGTMPFSSVLFGFDRNAFGGGDTFATVTLFALVAIFFYIALAIDRRSLLVPALGYFTTVGIISLVQTAAYTTGVPVFAVVLALVGILVIMFGAGWQRIRQLVLGTTLPESVLDKLPPVRIKTPTS